MRTVEKLQARVDESGVHIEIHYLHLQALLRVAREARRLVDEAVVNGWTKTIECGDSQCGYSFCDLSRALEDLS